ncbi:STAS domain-containing protein [Nannocystis radixulma]|uniref:STAS domain-containing protein n=1 Tax=Nannocystis radixulma TaxID=2995305 RepID=A0ABT5B4K9_9BACT|nr:STAS domain-containing protein [Nannocystis radixulma]MDC0668047.1 STAS domain-containing protein [Nannocystis radixulma]
MNDESSPAARNVEWALVIWPKGYPAAKPAAEPPPESLDRVLKAVRTASHGRRRGDSPGPRAGEPHSWSRLHSPTRPTLTACSRARRQPISDHLRGLRIVTMLRSNGVLGSFRRMSSHDNPSDRAGESDETLRQRIAELERQVAEQQRTIEALRETNALSLDNHDAQQSLLRLIDCSSDFIGIADMEGHALYVNAAGREMVGLGSMEETKRTLVQSYFDPADLPYVEDTILPIVIRTGQWSGEYRFRHMVTGAMIPVHYSLFLAKNARGEAIGLATITRDLRSMKLAEEERQRLQEEIIRIQASALAELSTPLIPISDRVVVMPLIGQLDETRAKLVLETLLDGISKRRAAIAILDVTGVSTVDSAVANGLVQAARAVRLLGAQVVLTGIRPEVAGTLVGLGLGLEGLVVRSTLQSGIAFAMDSG